MAVVGHDSGNSISTDEPDSDALGTAAARGDVRTVRRLLAAGVGANIPNSYGHTPLQVMKCCCADIAERLLRAGADPNIQDSHTLVTPAHDVARAGFMDTLRCLLRHGADITLTDRWGNSPAHVAAKHGHYHIVRFLSQGVVLSRCTNQHGLTPLDYVKTSSAGHAHLQWMLEAKNNPPTLASLSCIAVRQIMGPSRLCKYRTLPITRRLQKHVALQNRR